MRKYKNENVLSFSQNFFQNEAKTSISLYSTFFLSLFIPYLHAFLTLNSKNILYISQTAHNIYKIFTNIYKAYFKYFLNVFFVVLDCIDHKHLL